MELRTKDSIISRENILEFCPAFACQYFIFVLLRSCLVCIQPQILLLEWAMPVNISQSHDELRDETDMRIKR